MKDSKLSKDDIELINIRASIDYLNYLIVNT